MASRLRRGTGAAVSSLTFCSILSSTHPAIENRRSEAVNILAAVVAELTGRLKVRDLRRAQELAEENRALIVSKWNEFFGSES
jgi:hypothetical protein